VSKGQQIFRRLERAIKVAQDRGLEVVGYTVDRDDRIHVDTRKQPVHDVRVEQTRTIGPFNDAGEPIAVGLCKSDPTRGVKLPKLSGSIHTWSEDEIARFESHHPIGTKARLALALALGTAQRRNDLLRMGRQHIRNSELFVRQSKTGAELRIPISDELQQILNATELPHLTFLTNGTGKPYRPTDFSDQFRQWCREAELPEGCTVHGLRKAASRRLAEAGCTPHEIAAITGHRTLKEVERYTREVNQARLARQAMERGKRTKRDE
jgi:integrase